jgi:N-acetyl-alpha-D-muramate 1-phosphate uridylyltransferase
MTMLQHDQLACIVLTGGLGTRVKHISGPLPKSLIPFNGRPFILHHLDHLIESGIHRLLYSIGYNGDTIESLLRAQCPSHISIDFVADGPQLLGTGGAIRHVIDSLDLTEPLLITYGDSYLHIDIAALTHQYNATDKPVLMTVMRNNGQWDRSNCHYSNGSVTLYAKPGTPDYDNTFSFIDYGLLVIDPAIVTSLVPPNTPSDLSTLLTSLSRQGVLAGMEVSNRFYEIGSETGIAEFDAYLRSRNNVCHSQLRDRKT